jgi:uncharacterized protein involved in exopolysaccharide biosynthesis
MEEEIDLRKYLVPLLRRWRLIVFTPLLMMVVALLFLTFVSPAPFEAVATVAIVRWQTDISLDPNFRTVSDQDLPNAALYYRSDTRRNALARLVRSGTIAERVIVQLGERLPPDDRNATRLLSAVKGEVADNSDLLLVRARHSDPQVAAAIATTWAREYEHYVNDVYSAKPALSAAVQIELDRTRQDYQQAQQQLEQFIADNKIDVLTRQITMTEQLVNNLQQETIRTLSAAIEQRLRLHTVLIDQYLNAQHTATASLISKEVETRTALLADQYAAQIELERLIETARAFRAHIAAGGDASASSSALALILLKAQIFTDRKALPGTFQLNLDENGKSPTAAEYISDLDALIESLEQRRAQVLLDIDHAKHQLLAIQPLSPDLQRGDNPLQQAAAQQLDSLLDLDGLENVIPDAEKTALTAKIDAEAAKLATLRSTMEHEKARELELTQKRDLAWQTYTTMARKQTEVSIADTVQGGEVHMADGATVPDRRAFSLSYSILLAGALGVPLGCVLALLASVWASLRPWASQSAGFPPPERRSSH